MDLKKIGWAFAILIVVSIGLFILTEDAGALGDGLIVACLWYFNEKRREEKESSYT